MTGAQPRVLFAKAMRYGEEQKAAVQGPAKVILFGLPAMARQARAFDLDRDPEEHRPAPVSSAGGGPRALFEHLARYAGQRGAPAQPAPLRPIET